MPDAPTPDPAAPSPVAPGAPLELLPGTADLLVLRTLVRGPMHGLAVASRGRRRTAGVLTLGHAPLSQARHRVERRGEVAAAWRLSEHSRRARDSQRALAGRARPGAEASGGRRSAAAVFRGLDPAPGLAPGAAPGA